MKYRLNESRQTIDRLVPSGKDDHVGNPRSEDYLMYPRSGIKVFYFNQGQFFSSNVRENDAVKHPKS